ncbi:MAG: N-acetyltransferase family protein [Reyranellaceae bacterium]
MHALTVRKATAADLPAIVALLADDELGLTHENAGRPLDAAYVAAFAAIEADANQFMAVAEMGGDIVGCLQLSFIPGLSRSGMWRGQVESVRVAGARRGAGIGHELFQWVIEECRKRGCGLVQLTTHKARRDARRFYEDLGFAASHEGMKLSL